MFSCNFIGTNLCYEEEEKNSICNYPNNICSECAKNASIVNGICECNSGYSGIGYIDCVNGSFFFFFFFFFFFNFIIFPFFFFFYFFFFFFIFFFFFFN